MNAVRMAMERLLSLESATTHPRSRTVPVAGLALHMLEAGSGPPLLMLHGGGGGGANWYRLFPGLSASARLIAPDLPGFGLSPDMAVRPPLGNQAAEVLAGLLDALALPRVSVLGTSFGGLAGLRLAQHFPERVERLVLLDSAGLGRAVSWVVRLGSRNLVAPWALRPGEQGTRLLLRGLLTSSRLPPEHERALVVWLTEVGRAHSWGALRRFAGWRGQYEVVGARELRTLRLPVLVLWGECDRFFPVAQARLTVGNLADGRFHVLKGAGHSPNWECPEAVLVQVRRFLAEQH